jgi:metal-responsive CopG/Arc/MetJ family transcriptional regulator
MSVAEKRTQVYFSMELYRKIEKRAKEESRSLASVVREAVEKYLKEKDEIDWENDPFFRAAGFIRSNVTDMSINHDAYIYDMKRFKVKKK